MEAIELGVKQISRSLRCGYSRGVHEIDANKHREACDEIHNKQEFEEFFASVDRLNQTR
jgi:hypothetical protein